MCAANEAGYAEYAGVPGRVKTGCMETPEQQSIFCSLHKPCQMKPTEYGGHRVIETILRKKLTRNKTLYEVSVGIYILYFINHLTLNDISNYALYIIMIVITLCVGFMARNGRRGCDMGAC